MHRGSDWMLVRVIAQSLGVVRVVSGCGTGKLMGTRGV